jgi:hypothetical protein
MDAKKELAGILKLLEMLKCGPMRITQNGVDVTESEIEKLKPEIAYLKCIVAHPDDWWQRSPYGQKYD